MTDTRPVRASEQLDWEKLAAYLRREMNLDGEMRVSQFPGGHSNLTYDVAFGDFELVLRRPPFGPVPPRAHDMAREYRVLAAVHPHFPLAPQPYLLCEDTSVIGSVFYVMERRRGIVVRTEESFDETLRRTRRARQAGRIRRAPDSRLDGALARIENERRARYGRSRALARRADPE
jgi:aminoglycoside phosphotransferase (APT) family kinase protein